MPLVLLLALALSGPAAGTQPPTTEWPAGTGGAIEDGRNHGVVLFFRAVAQTGRDHPRCARPVARPPVFSSRAPSRDLVDKLGILRRPATPADRLPPGLRARLDGGAYVNWVRAVRSPDGRELFVVPAPDIAHEYLPRSCGRLIRARLQRILEGRRPAMRRDALEIQRAVLPSLLRPRKLRPVENAFAISRDGRVRTDPTPADQLDEGSFGELPRRDGRHTRIGLVADGVARIHLRFAAYRERPGARPTPATISFDVQDNLVLLDLPGDPAELELRRVTWERDDGTRWSSCADAC